MDHITKEKAEMLAIVYADFAKVRISEIETRQDLVDAQLATRRLVSLQEELDIRIKSNVTLKQLLIKLDKLRQVLDILEEE